MTGTLFETGHAKINLALHVRARRADGYHELETVFAFAEDGDRLSGEPADELSLTLSGPHAAGLDAGAGNLVLRAAQDLKATAGIRAGAALHLEKILPVASGIGGGSADAAAALRLLSALWQIDRDDPAIMTVAGRLGADVPACVRSETCFGSGRGDALSPLHDAALSGTPLLLVNPGFALPTGPVFAGWDGIDRGALDRTGWRHGRNDLTASAMAIVPEIGPLLDKLGAQKGVTLARMSGSGASCFALFDSVQARDAAARKFPFWHMSTVLR